MTAPTAKHRAHRLERQARLAIVVGIVLLLCNIALAAKAVEASRSLNASIASNESIVNANVRTIGQTQRELLRLSLLLESGSNDRNAIDLQRAFVTQRMSESSLPLQLQTLGSEALVRQARAMNEKWHVTVDPLVARIAADPTDADQPLRAKAIAAMHDEELTANDLASAGETNRKLLAGRASSFSRSLLGDASILFIGFTISTLAILAITAIAVVTISRSDRRRQRDEERLRLLNAELATLSQVASRTDNCVIITDARGAIEWVNDAFTEQLGYPASEAIGQRPGPLLQGPETDRVTSDFMRDRISRGKGFTCDILNYRKDGQRIWLALEVLPVRSDDGELTNFIGISTDITSRRDTEAHLIAAKDAAEETAAAKANFLASMSHEIRTPLNAVIGMSDLLMETELTRDQQELVETTQRSGAMLLSVVNNILTFSALDADKVQLEARPVDLRAAVASVQAIVSHDAAAKGLALRFDIEDDVPALVEADEVRLSQILLNLLANAVKFTPAGSVHTRVRTGADDQGNERITIEISDSGIGIPADRLSHLFEPFSQVDSSTTRRFGGTGLGLAITHRLVGLMGGEINVASSLGVGTTVRVHLPLRGFATKRRSAVHPAQDTTGPAVDTGLRVLVAEDDPVNQMVTERLLQRLGLIAEIVPNGDEVLRALTTRHYDVILMDINMPVRDGLSATRAIRDPQQGFSQPWIVAMTANALHGDRERFLAAGMDAYLSKPVRLADLRELLAGVEPRRAELDPAVI